MLSFLCHSAGLLKGHLSRHRYSSNIYDHAKRYLKNACFKLYCELYSEDISLCAVDKIYFEFVIVLFDLHSPIPLSLPYKK